MQPAARSSTRHWVRVFVAVVFVIGAIRCSVDSIDLAGKKCTCSEGWVCDSFTDTCVRKKASDASLDRSLDGSGAQSGGGNRANSVSTLRPACTGWHAVHCMICDRISACHYSRCVPAIFL